MSVMKTVTGDLVELAARGEFNVIVHGCNCFNSMGAGIAKQIAERFPEAEIADGDTLPGLESKLGSASIAVVRGDYGDSIIVVNAYTQLGTDMKRRTLNVSMAAIYRVFATTVYNLACLAPGMRIGIPRIGAGLGGGDWDTIKTVITKAMDLDGFDDPNLLTLVEYDGLK